MKEPTQLEFTLEDVISDLVSKVTSEIENSKSRLSLGDIISELIRGGTSHAMQDTVSRYISQFSVRPDTDYSVVASESQKVTGVSSGQNLNDYLQSFEYKKIEDTTDLNRNGTGLINVSDALRQYADFLDNVHLEFLDMKPESTILMETSDVSELVDDVAANDLYSYSRQNISRKTETSLSGLGTVDFNIVLNSVVSAVSDINRDLPTEDELNIRRLFDKKYPNYK